MQPKQITAPFIPIRMTVFQPHASFSPTKINQQPNEEPNPPPDRLQVIFYEPAHSKEADGGVASIPRWQQLANRIGKVELTQRVEISSFTAELTQLTDGETPCQVALRLAETASSSCRDTEFWNLLVVSFCSTLYTSGRAAPETLDKIITHVVKTFNYKYLDQIRRGAKFANEIIAAWAMTGTESKIRCLDRATQAVLQGNFHPLPGHRCIDRF